MATKPRRPSVKTEPLQIDADANDERRRASGQDSMPHRAAGETSRETTFFGSLPLTDREFLVKCRVDIERKFSIESHTLFDIGDILNAAKARLPHGAYLTWVDHILGITARTAQNYRGAAAAFGEEAREIISFLGPTVIYKLSGADPRLVELRTRLLAEISAGARPTGRQVEEMIAAVLGKEPPKANRSAKAKATASNPIVEDEICDATIVQADSATERVVELIFSICIYRVDELLSLLKPAKAENVGKLLIRKCESYCDCVGTAYTPMFNKRIEPIIGDKKLIASSGR